MGRVESWEEMERLGFEEVLQERERGGSLEEEEERKSEDEKKESEVGVGVKVAIFVVWI